MINYVNCQLEKMNKTQLCENPKINTNAMAKLGRNETVTIEILIKIYNALNCEIDDIVEYSMNKGEQNG